MNIVIRQANLKDLKYLQELGTELMLSDMRFDPAFNKDWYYTDDGVSYLKKYLSDKDHACFVAEIDNKLVGYAACKMLPNESWRPMQRAEIGNLLVNSDYRDHGIGHKLMHAFKTWAKKKGAVRLKVIVMSDNEAAIRFYADNGFKPLHKVMEAEF